MPRNTRIQLRRGTRQQWLDNPSATLAEGEIGYEIDTGRFKIGRTNGSTYQGLAYSDGSDLIPFSGIALQYSLDSDSYTISSVSISSGNGITVSPFLLGGNGTAAPSGSGYTIGLANRLQTLSLLNQASNTGLIVSIDSSGVTTRQLTNGNNINISNVNGVNGNPTISLSNALTEIAGITGVTTGYLNISSSTGIYISGATPYGVHVNNLYVDGDIDIGGNISIPLAAAIIANGSIVWSGTPSIFQGDTYFDRTPYVGPTGGTLGTNLFPVSLSGHTHTTGDIINFCSGVANCVDTALVASTGLQLTYSSSNNSIIASLSGQALALHNHATNGILVRTGNASYSSRTITPSGSNILIGSGDGVAGNPVIGLNPTIGNLSSLTSDTIYTDNIYPKTTNGNITLNTPLVITTGSLTVRGDLVIEGDTVTQNVSTIRVEDPSIRLGATTGVLSGSDTMDRGVEFVYRRSGTVPITGFFGYDHSSDSFAFLTTATNAAGEYSGTAALLNVGGLTSSARVSGTVLVSTVNDNTTSPLTVASSGLVANLNSDYLDNQHGAYYRNAVNITGVNASISGHLLPLASTTSSGIAYFDTNNFSVAADSKVSIKNDGITLGTHTTGQYASTISVAGTGISATAANAQDGTAYTISINSTDLCTNSTIVARNSVGNFCANYISGIIQNSDNIRISGISPSYTTTSILLTNTTASTGYQAAYIDSGLIYNASTDTLGLYNASGLYNTTWLNVSSPTYGSTSISGIIAMNGAVTGTYLHNFIVDGGTP